MIKKPMLAGTLKDWDALTFPALATPKLDGYRCLIVDGKAVSRKFKAIANKHVRGLLEVHCPSGFDGELMAGSTFSDVQSLIGSEDGTPAFKYMVFDYMASDPHVPYDCRVADLRKLQDTLPDFIELVLPVMVCSKSDLLAFEESCLAQGYEGAMIRKPTGPYKFGRSTEKEGYLLKIKRFADSEAIVLGYEELQHNANPAEKDNLGHTKRSTCKAGKVPAGTLGSMLVRDIYSGVGFKVSGSDQAMAKEVWENREYFMGKILKYKCQPAGAKDKPRFPIFLCWRDANDIGDPE